MATIPRLVEILELIFNKKTKSANVISELENETINGNVFYVERELAMDTADVIRFGAITPADKDVRLYPADLSADANYVKLEVYADADFTGIDEITPLNANGQSVNTSGVTVYSSFDGTPSIVGATRIALYATLGGTGVGQATSGSQTESKRPLVLKRSTKYLFVNTNFDGDGVTAVGKETWIETDLED